MVCGLVACTDGTPAPVASTPGGPVVFRVLSEGRSAQPCVEGPDSALAIDEDAWIGVFDRHTACLSSPDFTLPRVRFGTEVGLAIWWGQATCDALDVETTAAQRVGHELLVKARTSASGRCPRATGALESFIALQRSALFDGTQTLALELDGQPVAP